MTQTSVEWLYKNLLENPISNQDMEYNEAVFHNAKEMEKQQQEEFAIGFSKWCLDIGIYTHFKKTQGINKELLEIYKKEKGL